MSRFKAAGIHLGISFVIFVFLAYLVLFEWYPGIFFNTDGGWRGMRIIVGVDLVLGPTLTLVAYKAGKPGLKFDLTAIALADKKLLEAEIDTLSYCAEALGLDRVFVERTLARVTQSLD